MDAAPDAPSPDLQVVCLCAAWCRLCEGYRAVFEQVCAEQHLDARWIDIEDEAELVGDVDVETFPTILLVDAAAGLRFAGPLTPQPETLRRLLQRAADGGVAAGVDPALAALARRVRDGLRH